MPRVTEEHRERRRRQILDAARRCFARQGFHQTSMSDLLAESGLSAGAFYGYYRSKSELVAAVADDAVGGVLGLITPLAHRDPPLPVRDFVREALRATDAYAFGPDGVARLAPQVWSEAVRDPVVAAALETRYRQVIDVVAEVVRHDQVAGRIDEQADAAEVAAVLLSTIMGYLLQRLLFASVDADPYAAALAAITGARGGPGTGAVR
ncbi:UNVERIFIED_CONTAM: hypothetical protein LK11_20610 [Mumia flava]|nr:TetR/AcrR family transcriptional regulator [Mumia flava]